jgi:hypothetical protein
VVARTPDAVAGGTAKALHASAATVRWHGRSMVTVVPWVDPAGERQGLLTADLNHPVVGAASADPPIPEMPPFPTTARRVHHDALAFMSEKQRREALVWLQTGTMIGYKARSRETVNSWRTVVDQLRDTVDGQAWLAPTPYLNIDVTLYVDRTDDPLSTDIKITHSAVGDGLLTTLSVNGHRLNALPPRQRHAELTALLRRHLEHVAHAENSVRRLGSPIRQQLRCYAGVDGPRSWGGDVAGGGPTESCCGDR